MDPTGKIASQPWIADPATRSVMDALTAEGSDVRFVGGCVRDAILKLPVTDIDIGTPDPPEKVSRLLGRAGIRAIPTGVTHGTVTALVGERRFEITTLRLDLATDGRRAKVAFTDDWVADAARRDFTINTLSCTREGDVYDPFGGLADLGHGIVRFVGNAHERIEEDHLRLLRYFRFFATYGRPPPDRDALAACRGMSPKFAALSAERIREELFRILLAPNAADTLLLMCGERVLQHIADEAHNFGRLRTIAWLDSTALKRQTVVPDAVRRLAAVLDTDSAGAAALARRLKLSRRDGERLVALAAPEVDLTPGASDFSFRRVLYRVGSDLARDLVLLAWAGELAVEARREAQRSRGWIELLDKVDGWTSPSLPLTGDDVKALGYDEGPRVGRLLAEVEAWWMDGDFQADRASCLAELQLRAGGDESPTGDRRQ
jgi:poly(A) polymerase